MIADRKAVVAVAAVAFLSAICVLATPALGAFTASVDNPAASIGSGYMFLTATSGSTTQCTSVTAGPVPTTATFACTGSQMPAAGASSSAETLTASGSASFSSATYAAASCAPQALSNTAASADPMLVRGNVAFGQSGPLSGTALQVDGSTALAADVVQSAAPTTFSIGVWFKTSTASGGLLGFSDSPSGAAVANGDRFLALDASGHVVFSEGGTAATSPATYLNGLWHQAVAVSSVNSGGKHYNATLYVDGVAVATSSGSETAYSGYWQIGLAGAPGAATYLNGVLAHPVVFPTTLTAAQVGSLYAPPTSEAASVTAIGATDYWPLADTGSTTFAGPYPVIGATSPCSQADITVGTATKCVFPASASPCAAPASPVTALVAAGTLSLPPGSQTLTTTGAPGTGYVSFDTGLRLLIPVTIAENGFTQTFTWSSNVEVI